MNDVTRILSAIEQGDQHASAELLPLVTAEDANLNDKELAEICTTRALLAYRSGDFQAALEYIQKSMDHQPYSQVIALQALAQHALGETEKAVITLERASRQLVSSQGYHKGTGYFRRGSLTPLKPKRRSAARQDRNRNSALTPAVHVWRATADQNKLSITKPSITSGVTEGVGVYGDQKAPRVGLEPKPMS